MDMKVSVCIVTYNHENYIAQAIESALMQQVNFDYEILIGEDDSTDLTRAIVLDYQARYPERIRLFLNDRKNVIYINGKPTGRWNVINIRNHARGQYIAALDGDDYWTDATKLQQQVDFLEAHPQCVMCFHSALYVYEDGSQPSMLLRPHHRKEIYSMEDLLRRLPICHPTVMFRHGLIPEYPQWFYQVQAMDKCHHVMLAKYGDIGYIDTAMTVHRKHQGGLWTSKSDREQLEANLEAYQHIDAYLDYQYAPIVQQSSIDLLRSLGWALANEQWEQGPFAAACQKTVQRIEQWAASFSLPDKTTEEIVSALYTRLLFEAYRRRDLEAVRYCLPRAVRLNPEILQNRGVWSIGLRSLFGR